MGLSIPGYVLAGGRSSRMGVDKAWVVVDGRPMAVRVGRALLDGGALPVHVVGKDPKLANLGLPFVSDDSDRVHPLVGVCAALDHARSLGAARALVAPCDVPLLRGDAVARLLAADQPVVARAGGYRHSLFAVLDVEMRDALWRAVEVDSAARFALASLPGLDLPAEQLLNVNAPQEIPGGDDLLRR